MKLSELKDNEEYVIFMGFNRELRIGSVFASKILSLGGGKFHVEHRPIEYEVYEEDKLTAKEVKKAFKYIKKHYAYDDSGNLDKQAWKSIKKMLKHNTFTVDDYNENISRNFS